MKRSECGGFHAPDFKPGDCGTRDCHLDEGIAEIVYALWDAGVKTSTSCEGGGPPDLPCAHPTLRPKSWIRRQFSHVDDLGHDWVEIDMLTHRCKGCDTVDSLDGYNERHKIQVPAPMPEDRSELNAANAVIKDLKDRLARHGCTAVDTCPKPVLLPEDPFWDKLVNTITHSVMRHRIERDGFDCDDECYLDEIRPLTEEWKHRVEETLDLRERLTRANQAIMWLRTELARATQIVERRSR